MALTSHWNRSRIVAAAVLAALLAFAVALLRAQDAAAPAPQSSDAAPVSHPTLEEWARASHEMAGAANNLWAALTPEQQKQATFPFEDDERKNFHFIPRERKGLPLGQMTTTQRHLAHTLLSSGMGQRGFAAAMTIMSLEEILQHIEQGKGPRRDPEGYFFSLFGKPADTGTWGWRVEGHHLTLNFTIVNGRGIAGTPAFMGSNPGRVLDGPRKGLRVLADEEEMGFRLVRMLDDAQRKTATIDAKAPDDIITGANRQADVGEPRGIVATDLRPEQAAVLRGLVKLYAHRMRPEIANAELARIDEAGWDKVRFAWAGATEPGAAHYYRVHGPTFLIEFDNVQNNANHPHTVWRDLTGDFGEDLLRQHYEKDHKGAQ
jgi:hypothetical protein